ncbi:MAG: glutaredoxin family protein [Gammaproteobacteria bacterium]
MHTLKFVVALALAHGVVSTAGAVDVVECIDPKGGRYLTDLCPPGAKVASKKSIRTTKKPASEAVEQIAREHPVTLYAVPVCDACDLVRNQLQKRAVPFVEKDASKDLGIQEELKSLAGGLTVPAVGIGETVLTGYNRQALDAALTTAGYPAAADASGTTEPQPPATGD